MSEGNRLRIGWWLVPTFFLIKSSLQDNLITHSHLQFSQLLHGPELIVEQWVTLYYMGAFTLAIWSTIGWTEKFNNGICTHLLLLHRLKSSRNSSCLNNHRCELGLTSILKMTPAFTSLSSSFYFFAHFSWNMIIGIFPILNAI